MLRGMVPLLYQPPRRLGPFAACSAFSSGTIQHQGKLPTTPAAWTRAPQLKLADLALLAQQSQLSLKRLRISSGYSGMDSGCCGLGDCDGSHKEDLKKQFVGLAHLQELEVSCTMSMSGLEAHGIRALAASPPTQHCSEDLWLDRLEDLAKMCEPLTELRSLRIIRDALDSGDERWTETRLAELCRERNIALAVASHR